MINLKWKKRWTGWKKKAKAVDSVFENFVEKASELVEAAVKKIDAATSAVSNLFSSKEADVSKGHTEEPSRGQHPDPEVPGVTGPG